MFNNPLKELFPILKNVYDFSEIVLVGSDIASWIEILSVYQVDKVHYINQRVCRYAILPKNWEVSAILLSDTNGEVDFYELSNPLLNGTVSSDTLSQIWRNITVVSQSTKKSSSLSSFIKQNCIVNSSKLLVIDSFDGIKILNDLENLKISIVAVRVVDDEALDIFSLKTISIKMKDFGFKQIAIYEDNHPKIKTVVYVIDHKKQNEIDELTKVIKVQKELEGENKTLRETLEKEKQKRSEIEDELKVSRYILEQAFKFNSFDIFSMVLKAEEAHLIRDYKAAVQYWQQLSALMSNDMPQLFYKRLTQAYKKIGGFPSGTEEEEELRGTDDKHDFLRKLHTVLDPQLYLEIGMQTGKSLCLAKCKSIGIDPMPMISFELGINHEVITQSSDNFFLTTAQYTLSEPIDFAFIDGMHLFEYALRDLINVEKYSNKNTVIVIDDIFPGHIAQAERDRQTRAWTGDVWKLVSILKIYRKDLKINLLDIYPTGLMVIENLDSENSILEKNYQEIVEKFINKKINEKKYVERLEAKAPIEFLEDLRPKGSI